MKIASLSSDQLAAIRARTLIVAKYGRLFGHNLEFVKLFHYHHVCDTDCPAFKFNRKHV